MTTPFSDKTLVALIVGISLACGGLPRLGAYGPCNITLTNLSLQSGKPGTEIILFGTWGHLQGEKIPCINKGNMNRLEVLSWFPTRITARIPEDLEPGDYKVGVYCNELSEGGSFSTTWIDFKVLPAGEPSTFGEPAWRKRSKKISEHNGIPYRVTSYDGETLTVEIDLPALLSQRVEINARDSEPRLPEGIVGDEAEGLLRMGANYIDISYNTARIAAEFPLFGLNWNPFLEGETVEHLDRIQRYLEQ